MAIMATPALTMIKENLTTGFLWPAKPIGYPSGREMSFVARSGPLPNDVLRGLKLTRS
jgi:hypothetical protein